jgi:hypothetical protein
MLSNVAQSALRSDFRVMQSRTSSWTSAGSVNMTLRDTVLAGEVLGVMVRKTRYEPKRIYYFLSCNLYPLLQCHKLY